MTNLNHLATTIGLTNYTNGFHDRLHHLTATGDTDGVVDHAVAKLGLITSEVAEAIEEIRDGHAMTHTYYREDGKPEGVPSEVADIVIRALDFAAMFNIDIEAAVQEKLGYNATRQRMHGKAV